MLKHLLKAVWLLSVAGLLLVAVALSAARLWAPTLAEYREDVERVASEALGRPVTVDRMHASWRGLYPMLQLRDVVIGAAGASQEPFPIPEIRLRIDIIHYLRDREVRFSGIDIIGADLVLVRDESGTLYVEQFARAEGGSPAGVLAVLGISHVAIHDTSITFHDRLLDRPARRFSSVMLSLANRGSEHRLTGHARLPGDVGYRMQLDALFTGEGADPADWRGRVYVQGQQLLLSSLLEYWRPDARSRGVADFRLWVDLTAARVVALHSELDVRELQIDRKIGERMQSLSAKALGVQLGWRRTGDEWQSAIRLHTADQPAEEWVPFVVSVSGGEHEGIEHLRVSADQLVLDQLWQMLPAVPVLEDSHLDRILTLRPSGQLTGLDILLTRADGQIRLGRFEAHFEELGVAESAHTPYLAGLDGKVSGTGEAGLVELRSRNVDVTDSRLFRDILGFSELQGDIRWRRNEEGYQLEAGPLSLVNDDMALLAEFELTQPDEASSPHLDLTVDVETVDIGRVGHYLPAHIMSPTGVAWLDNSLVSGRVQDGEVRINGRLDQLPFDRGEGQLEVRLPVVNATLDYHDDWSPITGLDAQVDFTGRSMDITSRSGRIRTAGLQEVRARIPDLARPRLAIDGSVQGELGVMLRELGSSPLGERYGGFVDRAITTGNCDLRLDLDIPLQGTQEVAVAGRIALAGNALKIRNTVVALEDIRGELVFDHDGIEGEGLRTRVYGRPAEVRVWGEPDSSATHITLDTRLALPDLIPATQAALRTAFSGESDLRLQLTIHGAPVRGGSVSMSLEAASTLAGTAIALPPPLQKAADSRRPLSIKVGNVAHAERWVSFDYGDEVQGLLQVLVDDSGMTLGRGTLNLGGGTAAVRDRDGLLISGRLAALRLSDWQPWLEGGQGGPPFPVSAELDIGELELMDYTLNDLQLAADFAGRVWSVTVGGESTRGDVQLTQGLAGFEQIVMNMERLTISGAHDSKGARDGRIRPADMPALQVNTGQFVYNGTDFGALDLKAFAPADNLYRIERLALSSAVLDMRLEGEWLMTGDRHQSRVDLDITDGKMDELLTALGYERTMEGGQVFGRLQAAWPAPLWGVAPELIDGKLQLVIKDGQLLDIDPGAGRALGLFNLGRLPRRLTLDFSDLFSEGFRFDRIGGNFVLDYGNIYTTDLEVDGPAAKIEISGRVGLADRDYDKLVTVTPYIESSLPLAGAIAGGPAVGAVAVVAEKLLQGKLGLNRMAQKQYTVTGSWDEPVVTRLEPEPGPEEDTELADVFDE